MTINISRKLLGVLATSVLLSGCGATALVSTPTQNIDTIPLKIADLTEAQKQNWGHTDLLTDTIPGMSVDKAYAEIIGNKKGQQVIVAVLDSGMDLEHEDLDDVLWTNKKEVPGNNKDDDNNGYVDDIHGYNFLGESYNEQLEFARIIRLKIGSPALQAAAKSELDEERQKYLGYKAQLEPTYQVVTESDKQVAAHLGKKNYTKEEVMAIETTDESLTQSKNVVLQMFQYGDSISGVIEEISGQLKSITESLNYNLNTDFDGRKDVGDNPYDLTDIGYGNGNPQNRVDDESHGTHVAGIIAAERNNGKGANGVANNVALMSIRAVPNGDEYDKDIALGIRYAVDNGAKIINCSFGKSFSPEAIWVYDAIAYAASKDVLIVHAAGNDGSNLDDSKNPNYPNDHKNSANEYVSNVITVGALAENYGSEMVASFSNYGVANVDVFAPGDDIYSTVPDNKYEYNGGTSMAAPAVAGIAALIRSHYPKLTAPQVKKIIMQSGLTTKASVILGGDANNASTFDGASKSGKMANAYNALILADNVSKGKIKLDNNAK